MTLAQQRLTVLADWLKASSRGRRSPLGGEVEVGAYALILPQPLDRPPTPPLAAPHLPLWVPESQAIPGLPGSAEPVPVSQGRADARLLHLLWMFKGGHFEGALIGLMDSTKPLQDALDREIPGFDLLTWPVVFLPLWCLSPRDQLSALKSLPLISANRHLGPLLT